MKIQDLLENTAPRTRRQPVTMERVVQMLPDYQHAWQKYLNGDMIYRGMGSGVSGPSWVDPKQHDRQSANTSNLYTLFVDSDPAWSSYPDRSKSLVCTNTFSTATGYGGGQAHVVLFENHSRIGICSHNDWWVSFRHLISQLKKHKNYAIYDMSDLNKVLADAYQTLFAQQISLHSAQALRSDLNKLGEYLRDQDLNQLGRLGTKQQYTFQESGLFYLFQSQSDSLTHVLSALLDPEANDFSLTTVEAYENPESERELWSDGAAIMIPWKDVQTLKYKLGIS